MLQRSIASSSALAKRAAAPGGADRAAVRSTASDLTFSSMTLLALGE